jgi:hypothetical protein
MRWIEQHREEVAAAYGGQWIAVTGSGVVGHARDLRTVLRLTDRAGHLDPLVIGVSASPIDHVGV